jgi:hypothetical protein
MTSKNGQSIPCSIKTQKEITRYQKIIPFAFHTANDKLISVEKGG